MDYALKEGVYWISMWHGSQESLAQHLCPHKPHTIAPGEAVWERETILGKHQIPFVCLLAQKLARVTGVGLQASDRAVSTVHSCGACLHHKPLHAPVCDSRSQRG